MNLFSGPAKQNQHPLNLEKVKFLPCLCGKGGILQEQGPERPLSAQPT